MCSVVVIDDSSTFKKVFIEICFALKIHYWYLSRGNNQCNSVGHYHQFLNKTQTISGNDRSTNKVFIENVETSQYAWNGAPIADTDIPRSLAAVGLDFKFPLDVKLLPMPTLNEKY